MPLFDQVVLPTRITRVLAAILVGDHVLPHNVAADIRTALPTATHRRAARAVIRALYANGNRGDLKLVTEAAGEVAPAAVLPLLGYTLRDGRFAAHGIAMPGGWPESLPPDEDTPETWAGLRVHCHVRLVCPPTMAERRART
jgi:hypothetical protein